MGFIANFRRKLNDKDYRYKAIVGEVTPVFADRFETTNKDNILLERTDDRVNFVNLITQNGEIVEFHKNFDGLLADRKYKYKHRGDVEFEVNGIKHDMVYSLDGIGYLENRVGLYRVILVSDQYVFTEALSSGGVIIHSHDEIQRFKDMNAFSIEKV